MSDPLLDLAQRCSRQRQEFLLIEDRVLEVWAEQQHLTLREAYREVLTSGIFPESLERNFPTFNYQEQLKLFNSSVLIAGLGGLGGYQAQLLARIGVGRLLLADGDRFVPTNLNRQLFATRENLGKSKAMAAADFLYRINPAVEVHSSEQYLDPINYPSFLSQVDLALDALDNFMARRQLLIAARNAGKPTIHGAVLGQDGQLTTILPSDNPIFESEYLNQPSLSVESPSVIASSVALVASLQVQETIRLLLNLPLAYHGSLVHLDGYTGRMNFLPLW